MSVNGLHRIRWRLFAVARVLYRIRQVSVARDLVNIKQSRVLEEGVEMWTNGLHRIRGGRVAEARVHRTGRVSTTYISL